MLPPLIKQANDVFKGWPDQLLTVSLLIAAVVLVIVALKSPPLLKALVLAWVVMP
jgi:hypothetical protein